MARTHEALSRAALPLALRFLERRDVVRLAVAALEGDDAAVALWLLYGDAYPLVLDELQCLHVAAAEGCWRATTKLLAALHPANIKNTSIPDDPSPFERAVAAHASVQYVFPACVMYRAVARGDLRHIQWLHGTAQYETALAVRSAATARKLEVVQWLLDNIQSGELLQCWLRLEDSPEQVRAVGWIHQTDQQIHFCALSEAHGFCTRRENLWAPDARVPDLPLAEPFAEVGDQVALERLLQQIQGDKQRLFSRFAIVRAAQEGHLGLVQWLHSLDIHAWPLASAMGEAAANGHLGVVEWLFQFPENRVPETMSRAVEGGQLHIARWILAQDCPLLHISDYLYWSASARSMQLPALRFVHEELALTLAPISATFLGLTGDRALVQYVVDNVLPPDHDCETLVFDAAKKGTLDALQFLVEDRGFWSRKALRVAIERCGSGCAFARWIYDAAKKRAHRDGKPIDTVIDLSNISVFKIAREVSMETALWLVESLPELPASSFVAGIDAFHPEQLAHTSYSVLQGDGEEASTKPTMYAADVEALMTACVRTRPEVCIAIPWLPKLAVRADYRTLFDLLVQHGHPSLFTPDTRDHILAFSRNVTFMNTLLAYDPQSLYSPSITAWATKYGLRGQLRVPGM